MRNVLSGLMVFMILNLAACGSLTVQGDVRPAAEATRHQSATQSPGGLQPVERPKNDGVTPQATAAGVQPSTPLPAEAMVSDAGMPVVGWAGFVIGLPAGSQFDDKVDILMDDIDDFGIKGADEATEARIVSLRDTQRETHFWGRLICNVADFNNCQLLVERMFVDGVDAFPPASDRINGWTGYLIGNPPGSQFDDYFMPAGDDPVRYKYGIESAFSGAGGELGLAGEIAALRNTGKTIRIWGDMVCGTIDVGGCQIAVSKIDVDGTLYEITPVTLTP